MNEIHILSPHEGWCLMNRAALRDFGMTITEWLYRYERGEYDGDEYTMGGPMHNRFVTMEMLFPCIQYPRRVYNKETKSYESGLTAWKAT